MPKVMTVRKVARHARPNSKPHNTQNRYRLWNVSQVGQALRRGKFTGNVEEVLRILRQADGADH